MSRQSEVVLRNVYRITAIMSTSSVVRLSFILSTLETTVQQQQILFLMGLEYLGNRRKIQLVSFHYKHH